MKKIICIMLILTILLISSGCTQKSLTKSFGGAMNIYLEPNTKLELITWKDDSLWYLTRPMREDETAETHVYQQDSSFGIFEGKVTIIETNETQE